MNKLNDNTIRKYLQGEATEEELNDINNWIKSSGENARSLFLLEESYQSGKRNALAEERETKLAEKRLFNRLAQERLPQRRIGKMRNLLKYAAALTILLLVGGGVGYWAYHLIPSQEMRTIQARDEVQQVTLPDGSKVWLNRSTTLTYPAQFPKNERCVHMDGEAYFEVTKNEQKPFIVASEAMQVRVLGTTFNFKSSQTCQLVEASLIEGEIEVRGNRNEGMVILSPGQRAELNRANGRLLVKQVNTKLDATWYNGLIPFEKADIFTIAQTLEQFYPITIVFSADFKSDKTYSGALKKRGTIDSVLKSLNHAIPFNYKTKGDSLFISPQR